MRRSVLILSLIFVAFFNEGRSQRPEIEACFRPAYTSLRGNPLLDTIHRADLRLSVSVGGNFFLKENSIIGITILYEQKGSRGVTTSIGRDVNNQPTGTIKTYHRTEYGYMTVPVVWRKRYGRKVKFQFSGGFYTAYLLKSITISEGRDFYSSFDIKRSTKPFDFGLIAGADIYVPVTEKVSFRIGLDNNLGVSNVSSVSVADDGTIKHNSFGIVMGANFQL